MTGSNEPGKPARPPKTPAVQAPRQASPRQASTRQANAGQPWAPDPPRTVRTAVLLMYSGAALTAIGTVLSVIAIATGEKSLRASHPHATAAQLHATQNALIIVALVSAVIEIAAWLLLARANRGGLKWARIVATVLFGLSTVNLVRSIYGTVTIGNTIYSALIWLVGLAAVVLLWMRQSSAYFAAA